MRQYATPGARVANNPLFLRDVTPWPVNISWALLANRSSCFAGRELALAFAPLPPPRREAIEEQFIRVFEAQGTAADVGDMATQYGCEVVVVVPQDGAWTNDPFAAAPNIAWRKIATGAGGFTCGGSEDNDPHRRAAVESAIREERTSQFRRVTSAVDL